MGIPVCAMAVTYPVHSSLNVISSVSHCKVKEQVSTWTRPPAPGGVNVERPIAEYSQQVVDTQLWQL